MRARHSLPFLLLAILALGACGEAAVTAAEAPAPASLGTGEQARLAAALAALTPEDTGARFARSCAFCHATGNAGAPLVGDLAAWSARAAAGEERLLRHTLEGLGAMPPLGYCMDCTEADFRALIRFMLPAALRTPEAET